MCVVAAREERLRSDVAALAGRLRTIAEKLETFGPVQQAARLTFVAAEAQVCGGSSAMVLEAWDQAAAAWAAVSEPYPRAQALRHAAEAALAGGDRDGATERLRLAAAAGRRAGRGLFGRGDRAAGPAGPDRAGHFFRC